MFYKIVYHGGVNRILREVLFPFSKLFNKRLIAVSGKLNVKLNEHVQFDLLTNQTCFVTQDLYYLGAERYEFTELLSYLVKDSEVFFDIGANIGYFTVLASKINPNLKVYSFEPSTGPLHFLRKNVVLNRIDNQVEVVGKAVAEVNDTLTFYSVVSEKYPWVEHNLNGSHSLQNEHGRKKSREYPVETVSLEQFISERQLTRLDLIKLDTECTEHLILDSSVEVINQYRPIIISEIYNVIKPEVQRVREKMHGYNLYQMENDKLVLRRSILDENSLQGESNFVFCPQEKMDLIQDYILLD